MNAIYALASGGWWGLKLGASRQKWGGLYNGAQTDYVFAVLGERWADRQPVRAAAVLRLGFAGLRIAARSTSKFLSYTAAG